MGGVYTATPSYKHSTCLSLLRYSGVHCGGQTTDSCEECVSLPDDRHLRRQCDVVGEMGPGVAV